MSDLIERLSKIRSQYNCFDESEEPYYRTLSEAIEAIRKQSEIIACADCKHWVCHDRAMRILESRC